MKSFTHFIAEVRRNNPYTGGNQLAPVGEAHSGFDQPISGPMPKKKVSGFDMPVALPVGDGSPRARARGRAAARAAGRAFKKKKDAAKKAAKKTVNRKNI